MKFICRNKAVDLSEPRVMGVLNVTPDSFSDGGRYMDVESALDRAWQMIDEGAAIIDIGGESTRPGAVRPAVAVELNRIVPVVQHLAAASLPVPISVDTRHADVMKAAIDAGADIINDVEALHAPGAVDICATAKVGVCLMHMQGTPDTMQVQPHYANVVDEVRSYLEGRLAKCLRHGVSRESILLDPGFGFGKTCEHNYLLLKRLRVIAGIGMPVLVGLSRKSMIGSVLDVEVEKRTVGSVVAAMLAVQGGAKVVRAHDVFETIQGLKILRACVAVEG